MRGHLLTGAVLAMMIAESRRLQPDTDGIQIDGNVSKEPPEDCFDEWPVNPPLRMAAEHAFAPKRSKRRFRRLIGKAGAA